jgi:DNA-binding protein YbaB
MAKGFNRGPVAKSGGQSQSGMMQQLQKLQQQMEEEQAKLADELVTATAGGGAIKVTMTGDQKCREVVIDVNMALDQSRELANQRLAPLSGGLPF